MVTVLYVLSAEALVAAAFYFGYLIGRRVEKKSMHETAQLLEEAQRVDPELRQRFEEQQKAFDSLLNYNADVVYGRTHGLEESSST